MAYVLMVQRANFANGDDSPVRKAFQEAIAGTDEVRRLFTVQTQRTQRMREEWLNSGRWDGTGVFRPSLTRHQISAMFRDYVSYCGEP